MERDFDRLFRRRTGFADLNEALRRIHEKRDDLLLVLERPEIPLHNNLSESDIREWAKKRKISAGTRSELGRRCRDTFISLKKTCRKLGISLLLARHTGILEITGLLRTYPGLTEDETTLRKLCSALQDVGIDSLATGILFLRSPIAHSLRKNLADQDFQRTIFDAFEKRRRQTSISASVKAVAAASVSKLSNPALVIEPREQV